MSLIIILYTLVIKYSNRDKRDFEFKTLYKYNVLLLLNIKITIPITVELNHVICVLSVSRRWNSVGNIRYF